MDHVSTSSAVILRSQVFTELQSGEPFDMMWITCDRRRGTGGDIISAEGWMVVGPSPTLPKGKVAENAPASVRKDPNHPEHGTINVYNPENSGIHPHKVHIDLIQFFNGKRVIN